MEAEKQKAEASLTAFSSSLDSLESHLRPLLRALDSLRSTANEDELDALTRARLHITLSYSVASLFCMYLRTQGMDPTTHPVTAEITRIQEAFMRLRKVEMGLPADAQRMRDRERRRWIQEVQLKEAKLRNEVFPEEGELLEALLKGKKEEDDEMEYARVDKEEVQEMKTEHDKKEKKAKKNKDKKEKVAAKLKMKKDIKKEKKKEKKKRSKEKKKKKSEE